MAAHNENKDDNDNDEDIDYSTNLLALGADAWDDSALIDAFNRDLQFYKQSHQHQMIDLSKVSNMINFKKAKKLMSNMSMSSKYNHNKSLHHLL